MVRMELAKIQCFQEQLWAVETGWNDSPVVGGWMNRGNCPVSDP